MKSIVHYSEVVSENSPSYSQLVNMMGDGNHPDE